MSVFTIKSRVIANRDASPPLLTNPENSQGLVKSVVGVEKTTNIASDIGGAGTAIKLITIPSNARISRLEYAKEAFGTSSLDIAVFYPTTIPQGGLNAPARSLAGTVVASSLWTTNISNGDVAVGWTDAMGAAVSPTLQNRIKPLWDLLGLSSDPSIDFDLGFSVRTAVTTNGYVGLRASYVD